MLTAKPSWDQNGSLGLQRDSSCISEAAPGSPLLGLGGAGFEGGEGYYSALETILGLLIGCGIGEDVPPRPSVTFNFGAQVDKSPSSCSPSDIHLTP